MYPQRIGTSLEHGACKVIQSHFGILIVHADTALDCHRKCDCLLHCVHTCSNDARRLHEASSERARLNAVRWAADIEIDFLITHGFADARGFCQFCRIGPTQLQGNGMFVFCKS